VFLLLFIVHILLKPYSPQTNKIATMEKVQMLWIGRPLGPIELTAIRSFLNHGHPVDLYLYDHSLAVPAGTTVCDANEIYPESAVYAYPNGSVSAFSNDFRFELLHRRGGVWVDTDVVCLRPMDLIASREVAVATQVNERCCRGQPKFLATTHLLKMIADSPLTKECVRLQRAHGDATRSRTIEWGAGPMTIQKAVDNLNMQSVLLHPSVTSSCPYSRYTTLLGEKIEPYPSTLAECRGEVLHLWHEMWRRNGVDTTLPPLNSIFRGLYDAHNV
jgi:hypothetical protein